MRIILAGKSSSGVRPPAIAAVAVQSTIVEPFFDRSNLPRRWKRIETK